MNKMQSNVRIEKITLNIGTGKEQSSMDRAFALFKHILGDNFKPVKTTTNKRLQAWGLRPGLPIGCKVTIRDPAQIKKLLTQFLYAKDNALNSKCFDQFGNFSFGIPEYIDIKDVKYNPEISVIGLSVEVTLDKPGYRVKKRSYKKGIIGKKQVVSKQDSIDFMKKEFGIKILGE